MQGCLPGWVLLCSIVNWAGTDSKFDRINSFSKDFPIWTEPNSKFCLFMWRKGYLATYESFIILWYLFSKTILAFDTITRAKLALIFIFISNFFFLWSII